MILDVMLDTETLGTRPGCAVLSVAAVAFDAHTLEERGTFYARVRMASCKAAGLGADLDTLAWWMGQSEAARAEAFTGVWELEEAVEEFCARWAVWLPRYVWARGPEFDLTIWGHAIEAVGFEPPWRWAQACDVRSALRFLGLGADAVARKGTAHSALDDARHQLACLRRAAQLRGAVS